MIRILFISFGLEWHDDVWNMLAIESLVGDLKGAFPNDVYIGTQRVPFLVIVRRRRSLKMVVPSAQ